MNNFKNYSHRSGTFMLVALSVGWILLCLGQPVLAAGPVFQDNHTEAQIDIVLFKECAQEDVRLDGTIHFVTNVVVDNHGGVHFVDHFNQDLSGVGLVTGNRYRSVATSNTLNNFVNATEFTVSNSTLFVGQGPGNNKLLLKLLIHVTTTPNDDVTVDILDARMECI